MYIFFSLYAYILFSLSHLFTLRSIKLTIDRSQQLQLVRALH